MEFSYLSIDDKYGQREADKYENRAERYEEKEREDFNKKHFLI
jgi:hypothetical protein